MHLPLSAGQLLLAQDWKRPDERLVIKPHRDELRARCDALDAILDGLSLRQAARLHGVNRYTLAGMVRKAFALASDGRCYGYRACLPWGVRLPKPASPPVAPADGRPHVLQALLQAHPEIQTMLAEYRHALPPGRLPPSFRYLLKRIRDTLIEQGGGERWPFTVPDKGRRAFARHMRRTREQALKAGAPEHATLPTPVYRSLSQLLALQPYDRYEFDAHAKDVRFTLLLPNARGELVRHRITKVWLLLVIDVHSTAIFAWRLVFGQSYTALDVAHCFAKALNPWVARPLLVPGMTYVAGATMPQNLKAGCVGAHLTAMDNAMAHHAKLPVSIWTDHHDGILNMGPSHVPEIRSGVESMFKRFEDGALRLLPGGVIPARVLGETEVSTSPYKSADHPIAVQALEDLMDVIVTGHNVTPLPARQYRSPIDILLAHQADEGCWLPPPHGEDDAKSLTTQCLRRHLRGSRPRGKPVHIRLWGVVYRHPQLDQAWDLLGKRYAFLVDLDDLRTVRMVDDKLTEFFTLRAAPPWNVHAHDLTMRRRILKLSRSGELEIRGAESAISAYAAYTLASAAAGRAAAADQAANLLQLMAQGKLQPSPPLLLDDPSPRTLLVPRSGRVSFDHVRD